MSSCRRCFQSRELWEIPRPISTRLRLRSSWLKAPSISQAKERLEMWWERLGIFLAEKEMQTPRARTAQAPTLRPPQIYCRALAVCLIRTKPVPIIPGLTHQPRTPHQMFWISSKGFRRKNKELDGTSPRVPQEEQIPLHR